MIVTLGVTVCFIKPVTFTLYNRLMVSGLVSFLSLAGLNTQDETEAGGTKRNTPKTETKMQNINPRQHCKYINNHVTVCVRLLAFNNIKIEILGNDNPQTVHGENKFALIIFTT